MQKRQWRYALPFFVVVVVYWYYWRWILKLLRTKVWHWRDIWLLKWCAFLFGIAAGAYFHTYVIQYAWVIIIAALLLALRPAASYWKD
jgi:hypothetical protein